MKVARCGTLFTSGGFAHFIGWAFDCEGGPMPTHKECLRAILLHVAEHHGIKLAEPAPAEPREVVTPEVERLTQDAIAMARRAPRA